MREKLAELCHEQWSKWMEYLFSKCTRATRNHSRGMDDFIIPTYLVEKWQRQKDTPYTELSEEEKNSDRKEAERILSVLNNE